MEAGTHGNFSVAAASGHHGFAETGGFSTRIDITMKDGNITHLSTRDFENAAANSTMDHKTNGGQNNNQSGGGGCPEGDCDENKKGTNAVNTIVGAAAAGVEANSDQLSKNYKAKYGTKTLSADDITKQTQKSMKNTARGARGVGYGSSLVGFILGGYNFANSDGSWGDYGQLGVSFLSSGLTIGSVTAPLGIAIGITDLFGGFDGFYNHLDDQEKLYNLSGGVMLPLNSNGIPIFIQLKNK